MQEFTVGDTVSVNGREGKVVEIYMTNSSGFWTPWIRVRGENLFVGFYGDHATIQRIDLKIIRKIPRT
jgi:hypothetical protein